MWGTLCNYKLHFVLTFAVLTVDPCKPRFCLSWAYFLFIYLFWQAVSFPWQSQQQYTSSGTWLLRYVELIKQVPAKVKQLLFMEDRWSDGLRITSACCRVAEKSSDCQQQQPPSWQHENLIASQQVPEINCLHPHCIVAPHWLCNKLQRHLSDPPTLLDPHLKNGCMWASFTGGDKNQHLTTRNTEVQ